MIDRLGFGVGLLLAPVGTHKNNVAAREVDIDHVVKKYPGPSLGRARHPASV
jgi:hypothetical protein